jgi:hypothetical protein
LPEPRKPVTTVTGMRAPRTRRWRRPNGIASAVENSSVLADIVQTSRVVLPLSLPEMRAEGATRVPRAGSREAATRLRTHPVICKPWLSYFGT